MEFNPFDPEERFDITRNTQGLIDSPLLRGPKHLPPTFDPVAEAVKA